MRRSLLLVCLLLLLLLIGCALQRAEAKNRGPKSLIVMTPESGEYRPPRGALYLRVRMSGAGGGGSGSSNDFDAIFPGQSGNATSFGPYIASGGSGADTQPTGGGLGGTVTVSGEQTAGSYYVGLSGSPGENGQIIAYGYEAFANSYGSDTLHALPPGL